MTKKKDRQMDELRKVFDAADKDGDGKLSPAEWLSVLKDGGVDATELVLSFLDISFIIRQIIDKCGYKNYQNGNMYILFFFNIAQ